MAWNREQFREFLRNFVAQQISYTIQLGDTQEQDEKFLESCAPFLEEDAEFARRFRETLALNHAFQMHRLELIQYLKGKGDARD